MTAGESDSVNSRIGESANPRIGDPLNKSDWTLIGVCVAVAAICLFIIFNWFTAAFPEASIDFRYDRNASAAIAEQVLAEQHIDVRGMKHAAVFDGDDNAKIFLERSLGLTRANGVMRREVRAWWWRNRWFKPLQEEEFQVDVAPTGEIVSFTDVIPENRPLPAIDIAAARQMADAFLARRHVNLADLQLVSQSERQLPHRVQRIFTWESHSIHPAGAPYRHVVTVDGNRVSSYAQRLRVPEAWQRNYEELRSKNRLAGNADLVFLALTMVAVVAIFIIRLLRGDVRVRLVIGIAIVSVVLMTGVALNSYPIALAGYDTTTSYAAFLTQMFVGAVLQGVGVGMLLVVIVGAGEVLYRERLPQHLAIPRLWSRHVLTSKRVFLSFVLGYTLVAFFLAYQVVFYLVADKFGAWAPADVPYDEMLNTAFPWIAVLFAGFFPALSEEFMSRAFSIPFFERLLRSRVAAIVLAGFIWGFGHATYPNQPFYIRGVEVGCAGVLIGFLLYRFGLLPLLIWHYTVDALYTALLLLRSGNRYYVISSGLASLVFAVPMLIAIVLYIRNRGFIADGDLSNATLPVVPPPPKREAEIVTSAVPTVAVTRNRVVLCAVTVAIAIALLFARPASLDDVIDYRITPDRAKQIAATWAKPFARTFAAPVEGFRSWDRNSGREDGGSPSGFDSIAATYLLRQHLAVSRLVEIMQTRVPTATYVVRSFTPLQKEETLTEIDPRAARVAGFHRLQDEKKPGPQLEQAAALGIASRDFARYGLNIANFEVKEALAFQQPNRRDWLFHFQERQPIAAAAYRRVSVRVAGADITQFTTTIKVPDEVYREAAKQTVANVVVNLVRIVAGFFVLGLTIGGFVMAARKNGFRWRRALRWTAALAIVPIAIQLLRWPLHLFQYDTSMQWNTFITGEAITMARNAGLQIGLLFLALVAVDALYPHAFDLVTRARSAVGRPALLAALTAIAIVVIRRLVLQLLVNAFPAAASGSGFDVPDLVVISAPAFVVIGSAILRAIEVSAVVALFVYGLRGFNRPPWLPDVLAGVAIFLVSLDPSAKGAQIPVMVLGALTAAVLAWLIVRYILADNLLAYPLAAMLISLLSGAETLLQNQRPDLVLNGAVVAAAAVVLIGWAVAPGRRIAVT
jgi:membrane protease YdiL (CAAX protease family)